MEHLKKCVRQPSSRPNKRKTGEKVKKKPELVTELPETGRSRRKAATKARSTVAEFVKAMKTKYGDESSEEDQGVEANVDDSDDNFNLDNVTNNFYKQVKTGKRTTYQCTVCNNNFKKKEVVENHILAEHRDKLSEEDDYIE